MAVAVDAGVRATFMVFTFLIVSVNAWIGDLGAACERLTAVIGAHGQIKTGRDDKGEQKAGDQSAPHLPEPCLQAVHRLPYSFGGASWECVT